MANKLKLAFAAAVAVFGVAISQGSADAAGNAPNMGSIEQFLPDFVEEGVWKKGIVDGAFRLENVTDENANTWYSAPLDRSEEGRRYATVDVRIVDGDPEFSHAGLLYGYLEGRATRYFFTIETGQVSLFEIGDGSANAMMVTETDAVKDGWNTLTIVEDGNMIDLQINGRSVGGIGNETIGTGAVGIVAWGTGGFEFRNFDTGLNN